MSHKSREYRGVKLWFQALERKAYKMHVRVFLSKYRSPKVCPDCGGTRLRSGALAYRVQDKTLPALWDMPIAELEQWLVEAREVGLKQGRLNREISEIFRATLARLAFLNQVGLLPYAQSPGAHSFRG